MQRITNQPLQTGSIYMIWTRNKSYSKVTVTNVTPDTYTVEWLQPIVHKHTVSSRLQRDIIKRSDIIFSKYFLK